MLDELLATTQHTFSIFKARSSNGPETSGALRRRSYSNGNSAQGRRFERPPGLSGRIGRLASELDMSKSGVFAHFGPLDELQLAAIETAAGIYEAENSKAVVLRLLLAARADRELERMRTWRSSLSR